MPNRRAFCRHTSPNFLERHTVFLRKIGLVWQQNPPRLVIFPFFKQGLVLFLPGRTTRNTNQEFANCQEKMGKEANISYGGAAVGRPNRTDGDAPTADGVPVLFHGESLQRMAGRSESVGELTWAHMREIPIEDYRCPGPAPGSPPWPCRCTCGACTTRRRCCSTWRWALAASSPATPSCWRRCSAAMRAGTPGWNTRTSGESSGGGKHVRPYRPGRGLQSNCTKMRGKLPRFAQAIYKISC